MTAVRVKMRLRKNRAKWRRKGDWLRLRVKKEVRAQWEKTTEEIKRVQGKQVLRKIKSKQQKGKIRKMEVKSKNKPRNLSNLKNMCKANKKTSSHQVSVLRYRNYQYNKTNWVRTQTRGTLKRIELSWVNRVIKIKVILKTYLKRRKNKRQLLKTVMTNWWKLTKMNLKMQSSMI